MFSSPLAGMGEVAELDAWVVVCTVIVGSIGEIQSIQRKACIALLHAKKSPALCRRGFQA